MRNLWSRVVQWAVEAYNGDTVSLATFLRVRQVAFQNIESKIPLAKREALLKCQYMAAYKRDSKGR